MPENWGHLSGLGLAGIDLPPMRHESTLGALMRFAHANVLNALTVWKYMMPTRKARSIFGYAFDGFEWVKFNLAKTSIGWELPPKDEYLWCETEGNAAWLHAHFRYCPLCLESGYHSIWHQFLPLPTCPLHHYKLITHCMSCGAKTAQFRLSRQLMDRPFCCMTCKQPTSGVAPSLLAYYDFRQLHEKELDRAFLPLQKWHQTPQRGLLRNSLNYTPKDPGKERNCNNWLQMTKHPTLSRHIADCFLPLPDECQVLQFPTTVLEWRVSMEDRSHSSWGKKYHNFYTNSLRYSVLKCTLRVLRRWLVASANIDEKTFQAIVDEDPEICDAFRENNLEAFKKIVAYRRFVQIMNGIRVFLHTYQGRIPRLALRAIYLARFAEVYYVTQKTWKSKRFPYAEFYECSRWPEIHQLIGHLHTGIMCFPIVEGMPLPPFDCRASVTSNTYIKTPPGSIH